MRKAVFTLNVGNYEPKLREMTYPLFKLFARKIKADFIEITERKFPDYPVVCEKWQIYELGKGYDWIIYLDADALVHPECVDFTAWLDEDTCAHNGKDQAAIRFHYDEYFAKDRRNIGTCGWLTIAPARCLGLWEPPELSPAEIIDRCYPTISEWSCGLIDKAHLTDDYNMSRNLARRGFKHTTLIELLPKIELPNAEFFWHVYTVSGREKLRQMREIVWRWKIPKHIIDLKPSIFELIPWAIREWWRIRKAKREIATRYKYSLRR